MPDEIRRRIGIRGGCYTIPLVESYATGHGDQWTYVIMQMPFYYVWGFRPVLDG